MGCGSADSEGLVRTFPVSGTCLIDGAPGQGVVLVFHRVSSQGKLLAGSPRGVATVEADGSFKVTTFQTHDGAPDGEYAVTAQWPGDAPTNAAPDETGPDQLGGRYDLKSPAARVRVAETENLLAPIALETTSVEKARAKPRAQPLQ